ncbi:MAG: ATP-binding protein [Phycisphaerae bacterium]|nr:ATP-binding protein [Phycisphaerae bacterium]
MDKELFERLLYEEESPTLDCKKEQYPFAKASDDEKSELLKDLIGFTNAWRRSEAYILIGVEEVRGGRSIVVGIAKSDHLPDHSVQQFVNNLINRPMHFHYEAFGFEGKQVGIIRIELQARPIYLKRDYGKLEKEKVYIRRGSSTDPSKPASLEEIALMGQTAFPPSAELVVEFAQIERDDSLGPTISWNAEFCEMPPEEAIPDFVAPKEHDPLGIDLSILADPGSRLNTDYFRELANFEFVRRLFRPVRLLVTNVGQVAASHVQCELDIPADIGAHVMSDLPAAPKESSSMFREQALKGIKPAFRRYPGDTTIDRNDDRYRIEIDCGDLQPGRQVWSHVFYLGKGDNAALELAGKIYAANLPKPEDFTLRIAVNIARTSMSVHELQRLKPYAGQ